MYHIVWIPKHREVSLYKELCKYVGSVLKGLTDRKECRVDERHLLPDHIHVLISIPPNYLDSPVVGFIKGESTTSIARNYVGRRKNFTGQKFLARGHHVSTVGYDEEVIRNYIRQQEDEGRWVDQLELY
jgi:putative transposase